MRQPRELAVELHAWRTCTLAISRFMAVAVSAGACICGSYTQAMAVAGARAGASWRQLLRALSAALNVPAVCEVDNGRMCVLSA